MLINVLTLLMGTAMIIFNGPQSGLMSGCKIGPGAPSAESGKYKQANVANVLIGIGAIFIAIAGMVKGLVINFELSAPAANVMLL